MVRSTLRSGTRAENRVPLVGRPRSPAADSALIAATLAILGEDGYARLSMAGVAKRAGVSATTLYRRWSSKEELVGAALSSLKRPIDDPDSGSLCGDLRVLLAEIERQIRGSGALLRGLMGEMFKDPDLNRLAEERLRAPGRVVIEAILARAVARGEVPAQDPELARTVIVGPVLNLYLFNRGSPGISSELAPMIVAALRAYPGGVG